MRSASDEYDEDIIITIAVSVLTSWHKCYHEKQKLNIINNHHRHHWTISIQRQAISYDMRYSTFAIYNGKRINKNVLDKYCFFFLERFYIWTFCYLELVFLWNEKEKVVSSEKTFLSERHKYLCIRFLRAKFFRNPSDFLNFLSCLCHGSSKRSVFPIFLVMTH